MTAIVLILMRFFDKIFIELKSIHPCYFEFREYRDREKRRYPHHTFDMSETAI